MRNFQSRSDLNIEQRQRDVTATYGPTPSMLICLIGPPCAGKGTLARILSGTEGPRVIHVNTGALLRERAEHDADLKERLAAGKMATDEEVLSVLGTAAEQAEAQRQWLLLDGTPRRPEQLQALLSTPQALGGRLAVVILSAPPEVLLERTLARAHEGRPEDTRHGLTTRLELWEPQVIAIEAMARTMELPLLKLDGQQPPEQLAQEVQALMLELWARHSQEPATPQRLPRSLSALLMEHLRTESYASERMMETMSESGDDPLPPENRRLSAQMLAGQLTLHEGERELLSVKVQHRDRWADGLNLTHEQLRRAGMEESVHLETLRYKTQRSAQPEREMSISSHRTDSLPEARWRISVLSDGRFKVSPPQGRSEFCPSLKAAQLRVYGMMEEAMDRQPLEGRLAMKLGTHQGIPLLETVTEVRRGQEFIGVAMGRLQGAGQDWEALSAQQGRALFSDRKGLIPWREHLQRRHAELSGLAHTLMGYVSASLSRLSPDQAAETLLREQVSQWKALPLLPTPSSPSATREHNGLPMHGVRTSGMERLALRPLPGAQMALYLDRGGELWVVTGQATLAADIRATDRHGSVWITAGGEALIYEGNSPKPPAGARIFASLASVTPGAAGQTRQISVQPYSGTARALSDEAQTEQISVLLGRWSETFEVHAPLDERPPHSWLRPEL